MRVKFGKPFYSIYRSKPLFDKDILAVVTTETIGYLNRTGYDTDAIDRCAAVTTAAFGIMGKVAVMCGDDFALYKLEGNELVKQPGAKSKAIAYEIFTAFSNEPQIAYAHSTTLALFGFVNALAMENTKGTKATFSIATTSSLTPHLRGTIYGIHAYTNAYDSEDLSSLFQLATTSDFAEEVLANVGVFETYYSALLSYAFERPVIRELGEVAVGEVADGDLEKAVRTVAPIFEVYLSASLPVIKAFGHLLAEWPDVVEDLTDDEVSEFLSSIEVDSCTEVEHVVLCEKRHMREWLFDIVTDAEEYLPVEIGEPYVVGIAAALQKITKDPSLKRDLMRIIRYLSPRGNNDDFAIRPVF